MRGSVYRFKPVKGVGHEQQGRRYAVVVQADRFLHLSTWLIVPTSTRATTTYYRPAIEVPGLGPSLALCDGTVSIDPQIRLADKLGDLTFSEMREIDSALRLLMDLEFYN